MASAGLAAALDTYLGAADGEDAAMEDAAPPSLLSVSAAANEAAREAKLAAEEESNRKLAVAREQMAEFATARGDELARAEALLTNLHSALGGKLDQAMLDQIATTAGAIRSGIDEARATATGAAEDAARQRGSVEGTSASALIPTKRSRDDDPSAGAPAPAGASPQPSAAPQQQPDGMSLADAHPREVARYVPMRLENPFERSLLRLLESTLYVSEYTDNVDILTYQSKTKRVHKQLVEVCSILSGLLVATDYKLGQELIAERNFSENQAFFQNAFEVGRRHKVLNPEKMRGEYGKLMYLLMDAQASDVKQLLEFSMVKPLKTVHARLEAAGLLHLLDDPLVVQATAEIREAPGKPRAQVQREIKAKEQAREAIVRKYAPQGAQMRDRDVMKSIFASIGGAAKAAAPIRAEEIRQCMYSLSDHNAYLRFNKEPVDRAIQYLEAWFQPGSEGQHSLAISVGQNGARLSHNHARQYTYARQTLYLWREIMGDMFRLWCLAEEDLLREGNHYRLTDTGQGLNRVQNSPKVGAAMHGILQRCMAKLGGGWVGSAVVHLGDHNVPNALMFIDKYTQVPRILTPLMTVVEEVARVCQADGKVRAYVESAFGSAEQCQKAILCDFFKHAFDGSGADNFFDAGSCIDGRLTSAWNWCSKVEKKSYWPVFKLCGFSGFDGEFGGAR